jgi:hypothetical protein
MGQPASLSIMTKKTYEFKVTFHPAYQYYSIEFRAKPNPFTRFTNKMFGIDGFAGWHDVPGFSYLEAKNFTKEQIAQALPKIALNIEELIKPDSVVATTEVDF